MRENPPPSTILSLALQAMLASRLQKALNPQEFSSFLLKIPSDLDKVGTASARNYWIEADKTTLIQEIQLKRSNATEKIEYASPVALQLARSSTDALSVAAAIKHSLFQSIQSVPEQTTEAQIWHCCMASVNSQGWLFLKLSDMGIAVWLEALRLASPVVTAAPADVAKSTASCSQTKTDAADLFTLMYSHGRCCSLLNRWPQLSPPRWLTGPELRCQHVTERRLIAAIADTLDYLSASADQPVARTAVRVALQLSRRLEAFCAACRLPWPDSAAPDLDLLEVRLGLIAIVRALLQILLEQRLAVSAPTRL